MNTSREEPLGPVLPSSAENRKTKGSLTTHSLIGPPFPSLILSTAVLFSYGQLLRERRGSQPVVLSPIDALSCCGPLKDLLRWSQHRKQHQRDTEHLTSKDTQARSLLFLPLPSLSCQFEVTTGQGSCKRENPSLEWSLHWPPLCFL